MADSATRIAANLAKVRSAIADAEARSARLSGSVKLIAVVKYVGAAEARLLAEAGCLDLGESRPQQLWEKAERLADLPIRWHMIGHLQRNKVRRTLPPTSLIHSGDSLRLLRAVDEAAAELGKPTDVLLEVNISGEPAKHGFAPDEIEPLWPQIVALENVRVRGLMAMAGLSDDPHRAPADFAALRKLRDALAASAPPQIALNELSMGMSGDFEAAIAEGATMVRIGSALFEGLAP